MEDKLFASDVEFEEAMAQQEKKDMRKSGTPIFKQPASQNIKSGSVAATLQERRSTHGEFGENARCSEMIQSVLMQERNWTKLNYTQRAALRLIAQKLGRILSGNFNEQDHWKDIAGYAMLIHDRITNPVTLYTPDATAQLTISRNEVE